ncbi:MAG: nucleotide-binding protein [bacterium]
MRRDQAAGLRARRKTFSSASGSPPSMGAVGLVSGKGGVGKSMLAVNLAAAAAARSGRVLLIDGDLGLANTDLLMGLVPPYDLQDWMEGRAALRDVVCEGPSGLSLLLTGDSECAGRALRQALEGGGDPALAGLIAEQELVLVDLGAGIGAAVIELASACRPLWIVANPEPTSLADAYTTIKRLWDRNASLEIELVVNRARDAFAGERTHHALSRLTRRFLGRPVPLRAVIPEEPGLVRSVAEQRPLVLGSQRTTASRRLVLLAESLLEDSRPPASSVSG